ncbi:MAG: hypothetical protein HQ580_15065 [Planctomycetes bacterium]|nr:hypothetical protein [Planctomycetota bacterium]
MSAKTIDAKAIVQVFDKVVGGIRTTINDTNHNNAVDVKLDFKSINIDSKGILVWSKKKESALEISLATQVTPDQ